jgi:hypothetical protein
MAATITFPFVDKRVSVNPSEPLTLTMTRDIRKKFTMLANKATFGYDVNSLKLPLLIKLKDLLLPGMAPEPGKLHQVGLSND